MFGHFILRLTMQALFASFVVGHGRLLEPPSRASMWRSVLSVLNLSSSSSSCRKGFFSPVDHHDDQTGCEVANNSSKSKECGVCGDRLDLPTPRPHELGGQFGGGSVVRTYSQGDLLPLVIQFTEERTFVITVRICPVIGEEDKVKTLNILLTTI